MFDPEERNEDPEVFDDVMEAVAEECGKFGKIKAIFVDKVSPDGLVFIHWDAVKAAEQTKGLLHDRWYAGKQLGVEFLPASLFHERKSECANQK